MAVSPIDPVVEDALLEIDFGVNGMLVETRSADPSLSNTDSEDAAKSQREPASRAALAALLVWAVRECSAVRLAYHVSAALLAERTRELAALHTRHERLIEEYRAHRARHVQVAA